jgi:flagellar hook-basal body complex protein FliE
MSIETIRSLGAPLAELGAQPIQPQAQAPIERPSGPGFVETLGNALQKVDDMQLDADAQAEKVALGGGNLHEMSMALEKADVSMRLAMKVRSKLVDAYQEIMRMSV